MISLRDEVQQSINELQALLEKHQEDDAFLKAVKNKWDDEDNVCRVFVLSHLKEAKRLAADNSGCADDSGRKNVPISKWGAELSELAADNSGCSDNKERKNVPIPKTGTV